MGDTMEDRITELEVRFMHQEHTIQELNETVWRQELIIARLEQGLSLINEQLRTLDPSAARDPDEEERPPHY
ncbi:MAG: SlyX family protein [Pedobacter sp.]